MLIAPSATSNNNNSNLAPLKPPRLYRQLNLIRNNNSNNNNNNYNVISTTSSRPKIISEIRKSDGNLNSDGFRTKLAGDLLLKYGNERHWSPRFVSIKGGHLHISNHVGGGHGNSNNSTRETETGGRCCCCEKTTKLIPLRHLSLQAGPLPNSLALCRGPTIILTLQTNSVGTFDEWVTTIAIEIICQTPLDGVKYLDILTIAKCVKQPLKQLKDCNNQNDIQTNSENDVENIIKKCQNTNNYVPVREKLILFETLTKMGRKARSSEDVSLKKQLLFPNNHRKDGEIYKKTKSMHDLSTLKVQIAVRDICQFFESKIAQA